VQSYSFQNFWQ